MVGGDFNAQIGALQPFDAAACVGACGHGCRSARGERFVHWVLMHGLVVLNRQLDENLDVQQSIGRSTCSNRFCVVRFQDVC